MRARGENSGLGDRAYCVPDDGTFGRVSCASEPWRV